jgi:phosphoglycerate dehydrogenase-like enzyme
MRILFCGDTFPMARVMLQPRLPSDNLIVCRQDAIRESLAGVDVLVPLMSPIDRPIIDAGGFRLIQQFGTGLEGVDLDAARARGIWVANAAASARANADSVAEHALLLMLAVLRHLPAAEASVRTGVLGAPLGLALAGRTVCIVGLGAVGRALATRLGPFGARLIGLTRRPDPARTAAAGLEVCYGFADRMIAFAAADVLALCLPVTNETRGMIDAAAFAALPDDACVVNVARGALIDYAAAFDALSRGRLRGAGLDVFWQEPIAPDDPLLALPNVIATAHVAGVTDRSYAGITDAVVDNIERLRRGEPPAHRAA